MPFIKNGKEYYLGQCKSCFRSSQKDRERKNKKTEIWYGDSVYPTPLLNQARLLGLNQRMIAESAKVSPRRVYDWIKGKRKMSKYAADNLCADLGIPYNIVYHD